MRRFLAAIVLSLTLAACSRNPTPRSAVRSSPDVLTQEEIADLRVDNAYEAVQRLRPMFLRGRSTTSSTAYAVVFVDGIRRGAPETLRTIGAYLVSEIRYISAIDATTRYGTNIAGGVLQVTLIRR